MQKLNLEPETKCDFLIDVERKKIWQKELDILEIIKNICDENNLKYTLCGGSLLGAIRHGGYIPWDDDIDIIMPRKDYNKFLEIALSSIKSPYFVQYYKTEKGYYYGHAQIRNSNTTAIIKNDEYNTFNHGIFVDIFPVDNVPDDIKEREKFLKKVSRKKYLLSKYFLVKDDSVLKNIIKKIIFKTYWKIHNIDKELEKFETFLQKYDNVKTNQCGAVGFKYDEFKYENIWFEEFIETKFEYLNVKITKYYDELLTRQYGNYMKPVKVSSVHGNVIFDTEKSYKEYKY
jgi:lipopolysaccharide cholinephosphotransferase